MGENSFLINCIQKIYSDKIPVDHTRVPLSSNKTANALISKNVAFLRKHGFPKIPYWAVQIAGQLALSEIESTKANPAMVEMVHELQQTKTKLAKLQESESNYIGTITALHKQVIQLKKELGKL